MCYCLCLLGSANNIAVRVRQLYQDDLPRMYQRGGCPVGDLRQRTTSPTPSPTTPPGGRALINNPFVFQIYFCLLVSVILLLQ